MTAETVSAARRRAADFRRPHRRALCAGPALSLAAFCGSVRAGHGARRQRAWAILPLTPLAPADGGGDRRRATDHRLSAIARPAAIRISGRGATPSSRPSPAPPGAWARCSGSSWGSFPAQAYLALAYLGMTATEFIARSAHRPAYVAHTVLRAGPADRAAADPGRALSPTMTAVLVVLFRRRADQLLPAAWGG